MEKVKSYVIQEFWNGREGILPWLTSFDTQKKLIHPLIYSNKNIHNLENIINTIFGGENLTFTEVEDLGDNVIIQVSNKKNEGFLIDKYGNIFPSLQSLQQGNKVKKFVIIRSQTTQYPLLFVLVNEGGRNFIYLGFIKEYNNPFLHLEKPPFSYSIFPLEIARFGNRLLIAEMRDQRTRMWWTREHIIFDDINELQFANDDPDIPTLTFPEYYTILPPSTFFIFWEKWLITNEGVFFLYTSEISGSFAIFYQKIFNLAIPSEFGKSEDEITLTTCFANNILALGLRGITYVFQEDKLQEIMYQTDTESIIAPNSPLILRKFGYKYTTFPVIAFPLFMRFVLTDNYYIFLHNKKLYIFERQQEGNMIKGKVYLLTDFQTKELKYIKKIAPLRFFENFMFTTNEQETDLFSEPPFITGNILYSEKEYEIGNTWVNTREAGKYFIIEFEPHMTLQADFEIWYGTGR